MTSSALDHAKPELGGRAPGGPDKPGAGGSGSGPSGAGLFGDTARVGLLAFLGTVSMLFIGFTSAYILRRASADWRPLDAPWMLWLNTLVLAGSSVTLEAARRRLRGWDLPSAQTLTLATGALGGVFVVGQWLAWQQLAAQGVFLATNPHSSFFYLLTGVHIVHVLGGLGWFGAVFSRMRRLAMTPGEDGLALFATYWHFLGALWLYLLLLLFVY